MSKTSAGAELWHSSHRRQRGRCTPSSPPLRSSGQRSAQDTSQGIDQDSLAPPSQSRRAESTREMAPGAPRAPPRCAVTVPVSGLRFYRIPPAPALGLMAKFLAVPRCDAGVRSTCDTTDERRHPSRGCAACGASVGLCDCVCDCVADSALASRALARLSRLGGHTQGPHPAALCGCLEVSHDSCAVVSAPN